MKSLDKEPITRPEHPIKKKKSLSVRVEFTYAVSYSKGAVKTINWKEKYPSIKAAEQAISDAWGKQRTGRCLKLLNAKILE